MVDIGKMKPTATIETRDALEAKEDMVVFVSDASADDTVKSGPATYKYKDGTWTKISLSELGPKGMLNPRPIFGKME